jgi:hypothetical protein
MRQPAPDMLVGSVHQTLVAGAMQIIAYRRADDIDARFLKTGTVVTNLNAANIRRGNVADPNAKTVHGFGYQGLGHFCFKQNRSAYGRWASMIGRIHAPQTKQIALDYQGCSIVEPWYSFQNFCEWLSNEPFYGNSGYEIDKDLRVVGNRVYGPDTCCLIPKELNSLIGRDRRQNSHGSGVGFVPSTGRYYSHIWTRGVRTHLGTFETKESAQTAYRSAHRERVVEVGSALHREGKITDEHLDLIVIRFQDYGLNRGGEL